MKYELINYVPRCFYDLPFNLAIFPDIILPFFSFAIESFLYETDFTVDPDKNMSFKSSL